MNSIQNKFEFERRFFCSNFPEEYGTTTHSLILQSYYLAKDGYAIRVRLIAKDINNNSNMQISETFDINDFLAKHGDKFTESKMTIKGPGINGTRLEEEVDIDIVLGHELVLRADNHIIKKRHTLLIDTDLISVDVFGAENQGLIIAEVERDMPVVDLNIHNFYISEVTNDYRFSNDELSKNPYSNWSDEYATQLEKEGPVFLDQLGSNKFSNKFVAN